MLTPHQVSEKCAKFFETEVEAKEFAKYMRRYLHVSVINALEAQESGIYADWVREGHYHLSEFLEKIDPYLEKQ